MDLRFDESYERLREQVRAFARASWPLQGDEAGLSLREQEILFKKRAIEAGWLFRTVPREYGGAGTETDVLAETVIRQEFDAAAAPWRGSAQGTGMLVPTLLEAGTPEQCRTYISRTITGELLWCQGYSEPGSGSDLASLQSRAELVGDEWVINGHKIWTSNALEADFMFGLFRTEPDAGKHAGISYLLLDMNTPGIDPRSLKQMNGGMDFCEVFFNDVRIPAGNLVGKRGEGWKVSRATLKHERMLIGDPTNQRRTFSELVALARSATHRGRPSIETPEVRQRLAELDGYVTTLEYASYRLVSALAKGEDARVMAELLTAKLQGTNISQRIAKLAIDLLEDDALVAPSADDAAMRMRREYTRGAWVSQYMSSLGGAIAGGASNIQRNIIGERLLGLPRDIRPS